MGQFQTEDYRGCLRYAVLTDIELATRTDTSDVKSGNTRTVVTSCKLSGSSVITRSILTSTSDTHFRTETFATFNPPIFGRSHDSMTQEETFVGACPASMHPGDHQLPDGTIQHRR